MVNFQDLFVIDVEVDVEEDPERKQGTHFQNVEQPVAPRELGGTALRDGGWSGMEQARRASKFEKRRRRALTWE